MRAFLLAAVAVPFVLAQPAAAQAGTHLTIRSVAGGDAFCMDAKEDQKADGTEVFMYRCHGRENQRWTVTTSADNHVAIIGTGGFCLDVRGRHSRRDGTPIQLWTCHFQANQRFSISGDGRIREVASGKCLQALAEQDAAPIVLDDCRMNPWEVWQFVH